MLPQLSLVVSRPTTRPAEMPTYRTLGLPRRRSLVLFGPGFIAQHGSIERPACLVDLASTTAA